MGQKEINNTDTICALATASGGALGIIRISGPAAFAAVSSLCSVRCDCVAANTIHYTHIVAPPPSGGGRGEALIDEVMVSVFRAPHSYTGEDSVEISCHGSRYILNKVLDLLVQQGCRMANPGEYTMRAYLNGKLDLSQAEAVADLISSTNQATHHLAMSQLKGHFSSELKTLRAQLLHLTSLLELELDFSDHEDLEFADRSELLALANKIVTRIQQLANSFEKGQALKNGIPVAIVGKTNVGKSTLLNQLLGDDRAIVSDVHGTTRDTIEDTIDIRGLQFRFIDTAGLRQTTDRVEQIGIDRTKQKINEARIVLWLLDAPPTEEEHNEMHQLLKGKEHICVHNKADLLAPPAFTDAPLSQDSPSPGAPLSQQSSSSPMVRYAAALPQHTLLISAKQGTGIENLKNHIYESAQRLGLTGNEVIVTNARHYDALLRAHTSLQRVLDGLYTNLSADLLSEDLRDVITILSEITGGQITPQETLNNIFSHFCIGK